MKPRWTLCTLVSKRENVQENNEKYDICLKPYINCSQRIVKCNYVSLPILTLIILREASPVAQLLLALLVLHPLLLRVTPHVQRPAVAFHT